MTAFPFLRLAAVGVLVLSLGLTACGRRGGLDLPPRSTASQNSDQQAQSSDAGLDEYGNPLPPRGQKKSFPLDVILN